MALNARMSQLAGAVAAAAAIAPVAIPHSAGSDDHPTAAHGERMGGSRYAHSTVGSLLPLGYRVNPLFNEPGTGLGLPSLRSQVGQSGLGV